MIQERRHTEKEVLQVTLQHLQKHQPPEKQQPTQSDTFAGTQKEHQPSEFSSDDDKTLPDPFPSAKTFGTKAPKSIPKKPRFNSSQK